MYTLTKRIFRDGQHQESTIFRSTFMETIHENVVKWCEQENMIILVKSDVHYCCIEDVESEKISKIGICSITSNVPL